MEIIGIEKNSMVDYPGKIAAVFFTPGCNFNCWYCHNKSILKEQRGSYLEVNLIRMLEERREFLDAVVISGGEPTLQSDLVNFIRKVKGMGFLVKLDTNGTNPEVLEELVKEKLIDYVAMDLKQSFDKYEEVTCVPVKIDKVRRSINFLMQGEIPYEFRTTFVVGMSPIDIENIAKEIAGANKFYIQKYNPQLGEENLDVHKKLVYHNALILAQKYVKNTKLRGF